MIINAGRRTIDAGYQNDNNATTVAFDISKYIEEYGEGTWGVRLKREGDPDGYPSTHFEVIEDVLYYTFTSGDCAEAGMGEIQLSLIAEDNTTKMSKVYYFYVNESLGSTATPPDPWQDYITTIQGYAQRAEAACGYYPRIAQDTGNWEVYNVTAGYWVDTGIHAKGDKGDPGESWVQLNSNTNVGGIIMDKNGKIAKAIAGTDYLEPSALTSHNADANAHAAALLPYSLISNTGSKIDLVCDSVQYKLYAKLYDANNNEISRSTVIDLPIESLIMNIYYDAQNKELVVTYKSGTQARIPIGDIITGLATQDWVRAYHDPSKQDALPSGSNDRYLHKNATTGVLEWAEVEVVEDYEDLTGHPTINNVELTGNKTSEDLDMYTQDEVDAEIARLDERCDNLQNLGRYLSLWNTSTGKPETDPSSLPYVYKSGDYYRIGTVAESNPKKPSGSSYTGEASSTIESESISVGDVYFYDGSSWSLQINHSSDVYTKTEANALFATKTELNAKSTVSVSASGSATDEVQYITINGVEKKLSGGGGIWGSIIGTLSNQSDLQSALNSKQNNVYVGDTPPLEAVDGDLWIDTSEEI